MEKEALVVRGQKVIERPMVVEMVLKVLQEQVEARGFEASAQVRKMEVDASELPERGIVVAEVSKVVLAAEK